MILDSRTVPYTYKGITTSLGPIRGHHCVSCGESLLSADAAQTISDAMLEFNKSVNASQVDPVFIHRVRRKLHLDQREAAEIFGGGVNAFSRYETGRTRPPLALVKLLRVLDRHPDLLEEIRDN